MSTVKVRIVCVSDTVSKALVNLYTFPTSSQVYSTITLLAKDTNYPKETFSSTLEILQTKAVFQN